MPGIPILANAAKFDEIRITTRDGVSLHGWFVPAPDAQHVILFCHGNAGNISHRLDSIRIFQLVPGMPMVVVCAMAG